MTEPTTTADPVPDDVAPDKPRASVVQRLGRRLSAGLRHSWAGLGHWLATGQQSGDEIRRRIIMRQLGAYEDARETMRSEVSSVRKKIVRLERLGVAEGWTPEQRQEMRTLREERKWREAALTELLREPFRPLQPTSAQIRRHRYAGSTRRALLLVALAAGVVAGLVQAPRFAVLLPVVVLAALAWMGGRPPALAYRPVPEFLLTRPELTPPPPEEAAAVLAVEAEDGETDLRGIEDPDAVTQRIGWALARRNLKVREIHSTRRTGWGWQSTIVLRDGTSADVVRLLPKLDTDFRAPTGRTLAAGVPEDGASVVLRVLLRDPFASPPPFPARAPRSCSIRDPWNPCISIDGESTELVLAGSNVLVDAAPGGGKSVFTRSLADFVTACRDAVTWDIDPTGRGLGPFGIVADHRALTLDDAEAALALLVAYAERRSAILGPAVDNWEPTEEAPAIVAVVDEYHRLSKAAKEHAITLLRIGRKARITLVICTQDASEAVLGDAVAGIFNIRVMLPCRADDVPIVVDNKAAVSQGWLPHLLTPGDLTDPADAGKCYVISPRHKAPILRYTLPLDAQAALARATERAAAGLPRLDDATTGRVDAPAVPLFLARMLAAFAAEGDPEYLPVARIVEPLASEEPEIWRQWDARKDRLAMVGREIRSRLQGEGVTVTPSRLNDLPGRPMGYLLAELQQAAASVPH